MEPSDIDGPKGGETPGDCLRRILLDEGGTIIPEDMGNPWTCGYLDLDAIASAFKAAVLAGEV